MISKCQTCHTFFFQMTLLDNKIFIFSVGFVAKLVLNSFFIMGALVLLRRRPVFYFRKQGLSLLFHNDLNTILKGSVTLINRLYSLLNAVILRWLQLVRISCISWNHSNVTSRTLMVLWSSLERQQKSTEFQTKNKHLTDFCSYSIRVLKTALVFVLYVTHSTSTSFIK